MNFIKFPVETTNIFPMANTHDGGQFVTEFNLKSTDSVVVAESIEYVAGPSYTHSEKDFYVRCLSDNSLYFNTQFAASTNVIEILPGRAVVDGHFFESLVSITLDLAEINAELVERGEAPLTGNLAIGLRAMYSTEQNISGSILVEETDPDTGVSMYAGVQIVILPKDEFHLPTSVFTLNGEVIDCGAEENQVYVNAHILLATFSYVNGTISNLSNNYPNKCQYIPAVRIGNIDVILSDSYVKKSGLNPKRLYTFAGKGVNPETGYDTWCDSTNALMVWDNVVPEYTTTPPTIVKATFTTSATGRTQLVVPHKQIDSSTAGYDMESGDGTQQYFAPVVLDLPLADFATGTPGTVDWNYTKSVKRVLSRINDIYQLTNGHQIMFIDLLTDRTELPPISSDWTVGDYILVAKDNTIISELNDTLNLTPPSSMYVVLPGFVRRINPGVTTKPPGVELDVKYLDDRDSESDTPWAIVTWWDLGSDYYRGQVDIDYFTLVYTEHDGDQETVTNYYFTVSQTSVDRAYSEPIQLTGQMPFAEETLVGGFLNVPEDAIDYGYVYLDDEGHLRLRDYALLRSGTLAYQISEDFVVPAGLSIEETQAYLDEYVNQRIAFPNSQSANNPNVINITMTLTASDEGGVINIYDIDSRFNTAINLRIYGEAGSNVVINISDCQRVKIEPLIGGTPIINLYRSNLCYDATVLGYLSEIVDLGLWYSKFSADDPDLIVEGMTVRTAVAGNVASNYALQPMDYWSPDNPNDNHFMVALQSLTFSSTGVINGAGVLVRNNTTSNVEIGNFISHYPFELPQGPALYYPINRLLSRVYVTGQFISAYAISEPEGYVVQDTKFTLQTPYYDSSSTQQGSGDIAFVTNVYQVNVSDPDSIDEFDPGLFHHFSGTTQF